jgi:hypothetical protein
MYQLQNVGIQLRSASKEESFLIEYLYLMLQGTFTLQALNG